MTFAPFLQASELRRYFNGSFWHRISRSPFFVGCLIGVSMVVGLPRLATAQTAVGLTAATSQTAVGLNVAPSTTQDPPKYLRVFWNKAFGLEYKPKNSSLVLTKAAPATNLRRGSLGCGGRVPH